jgi:HlyD family secretion protein
MDRAGRELLWVLAAGTSLLVAGCQKGQTPNTVSGIIEMDEAHLASRYGGRVEKLFPREGDSLTNGQLIARLEAPELAANRQEALATLQELEAGPRKEEIATAKHEWESQVAQLELARVEEARARKLFEGKTITPQELDRAVTQAAALEKTVAASKSRHELLLAGTRPERIAQAKARVEQLNTQIRELEVIAPTNCVLETLQVKVGDVLTPNRDIATVLLPHLWVRVYVPEPWLGHIKVNEQVNVRVDSFPGRDFPGRVEQISRMAEFTPRNTQTVAERIKQVFGVKIDLTQHQAELRAGMAADAFFPNVPAPANP